MQDSKGNMWFATSYGVSCYDGYRFRNYTMEDGLPDNTIFECYEDYKGRIWFVSFSCRLSYFENDKIIPFKYNDKLLSQINTNSLKTSFYVDRNDNIYLSLYWQGAFIIDRWGNFKRNKELTNTFTETPTGTFVCSSYYGQVEGSDPRSNKELRSAESIINFKFKTENFQFVSDGSIMTVTPQIKMLKWGKNEFIINVGNRLFILDRKARTFNLFRSFENRIIDIFTDKNNRLWVATEKSGVYVISKQNEKLYHFLNGITVTSIAMDKEGGVWLSSYGSGIYYTSSIQVLNYSIGSHFPSRGNPVGIAYNYNKLYFAVQGQGVYLREDAAFTKLKLINFKDVTDIKYDQLGGKLWVSSTTFAISIDTVGNIKKTDRIYLVHLYINGKNKWWGASGDRLIYCEDGDIKLDSRAITVPFRSSCLTLDNAGNPIIGNVYGLWSFINNRFIKYDSTQAFLNNKITAVATDKNNNLYVGSGGFGLWIKRNDNIRILTKSDGLIDNYIKSIFIDGDSLWLGTNKGICCIYLPSVTSEKPLITNLTSHDGLISDEIHQIDVHKDTVWVVSKKGLSFFNKKTFKDDNSVPALRFNKILVNDVQVNNGSLTDLQYNENDISFYYSGLSFKDNKSIIYRYKLIPLDTSWTFTSNRDVRYTSIPPGKYTFMVSAGKTGHSNYSPSLIFPISIAPPWWSTWEFKLILLLLCSGVILFYFRYRIRKVRSENRVGKRMMELEAKALRAQMNPHFIFNCLNSIQSFIAVNDTRSAEKYLAEFARLIRMILDNSRESSITIEQEIETLRYYLKLERQRFNGKFNFVLDVSPEVQTDETYIPSMLIQPYIENAILHGLAGVPHSGMVSIKFELSGSRVKCIVEDNGVGREKTLQLKRQSLFNYRSAGSEISRERFEIMNNSSEKEDFSVVVIDLKNEDEIASGTRVEMYITPIIR